MGKKKHSHGSILWRCGVVMRDDINAACKKFALSQDALLARAVRSFLADTAAGEEDFTDIDDTEYDADEPWDEEL